jgi:hypothetical protein
MSNIKAALRTAAPALELETVTVTDIAQETGAIDVRLVAHAGTGNSYVHFVNDQEEYLSVKVGKKCDVSGPAEKQIADLINNYLIYTGTGDNGTWFTFGPKASAQPTKTVSLASILGKQKLEGAKP